MNYKIPKLPLAIDLETKPVLRQLNLANRKLAELKGVEQTAENTIRLVKEISSLMLQFKHTIRPLLGRSYRHDLLNNLFSHPYTKISFVQEILQVSRLTATQYLEKIRAAGLLQKVKSGRNNYYLNLPLCELFANFTKPRNNQ
jgi:Fic family protein